MGTNFFEKIVSSANESSIRIRNHNFTPSDCTKLLQTIVIKKDALNAETRYRDILTRAKKKLSESAAKGLQDILDPLYTKTLAIFRSLISMEDGSPHAHADFNALDASLMAFEQEVKKLFKQYSKTIFVLQLALVPFMQSFIEDKRTKESLAVAFKEKSLKPFLYQMVVNEFEEFGITVPVVNESECKLDTIEDAVLKTVVEKISAVESTGKKTTAQEQHIRDLAYLRNLNGGDYYYLNSSSKRNLKWEKCRLAELDTEQLLTQIQAVLRTETESPETNNAVYQEQRTVLHLLAILHQIYINLSHSPLKEEDLAAILLALSQSKVELQWQLDVQQVSAPALLLYITVLCLRGDVVHIEQAERLLGLRDSAGNQQEFLRLLKIVYTEYHHELTDKLGVFHLQTPKMEAKTHYFGSQIIQFSSHPAVNSYLAQTLLELKQQILQPFDAWYAVLSQNSNQPELQQYRETLLEIVEKMWMWRVHNQSPYHHLKKIDYMIELFQQHDLPRIWQNTENKLVAWSTSQELSQNARQRINFLRMNSTKIYQDLRLKHHAHYAATLPVLDLSGDVEKHILQARLYYDQNCWSGSERMQWIQSYLKRQIIRLQRICPEVRRVSDSIEQFKIFIEYFAAQSGNHQLSVESISAVQIGMQTYRCVEAILPWAREGNIPEMITNLTAITNATARQTLAQTVMTKLNWVTNTDSFYYQWFESKTVKQAAGRIYEAAQAVVAAPENSSALQNFLSTMVEQQHRLAQDWHFPWGWFWGYQDTREILATTLEQVRTMITMQQIPAYQLQAAEEAGHCAIVLEGLRSEIQRMEIEPTKIMAWNTVLATMKTIQKSYSGFAMLYELQSYLESQRQKFLLKRYSYFYGPRYTDQTDSLLRVLEKALEQIGQDAQMALANPAFLSQKARQIQTQHHEISEVNIQPGYCETQYFDMWIRSTEPVTNFQQEAQNTWYKRFYHAKDLFAFSRETGILQQGTDVLNMSFV